MFRFLKNYTYPKLHILQYFAKWGPIGVDIGDDALKMVQLENNGKETNLIAGGSENRPADVEPGSANWQRWAVEAIKNLTSNTKFHGKEVIAAMPASEVLIDHIKMPKIKDTLPNTKRRSWGADDKLQDAILSKIKQKLPIDSAHAMIKYIPAEEDDVMVIATEREKINRHLAIYEKANLQIKSITVWPAALANCYTRFFGRRKADLEAIVMLLDIEPNRTNTVICRHKNLLFAHSTPIGLKQLESTEEMMTRLVLELTACRRQFGSMYKKAQIVRLVFLSGRAIDRDICETIAKQLGIPAQIGDCLAAVEMPAHRDGAGMDRRGCQVNWATAFGLSLS